MRNQNVLKLVAAMLSIAMLAAVGCTKKSGSGTSASPEGVILGCSIEGIVALEVPSGDLKVVLRHDGTNRFNSPVYSPASGLCFLDRGNVYCWDGQCKPKLLYAPSAGRLIKTSGGLSLSPSGMSLAFSEANESPRLSDKPVVKVINLKNGDVREIDAMIHADTVKWATEDSIVGWYFEGEKKPLRVILREYNLVSGRLRELKDITELWDTSNQNVSFDITYAGNKLVLIYGDPAISANRIINNVQEYDLATMKLLLEGSDDSLLGDACNFCVLDSKRIAMFRRYDPMSPIKIGMYVFDINAKKGYVLSDRNLSDMVYIPGWNGVAMVKTPSQPASQSTTKSTAKPKDRPAPGGVENKIEGAIFRTAPL